MPIRRSAVSGASPSAMHTSKSDDPHPAPRATFSRGEKDAWQRDNSRIRARAGQHPLFQGTTYGLSLLFRNSTIFSMAASRLGSGQQGLK